MSPDIITKILAAGAMGASIFCIWKVYDLLRNEQDKDEPRPVFIRTIYVAMGFAVIMTLLSLGIEVVRHNMGMEVDTNPRLDKKLEDIVGNNYYSLKNDGTPAAITLPLGDSTLTLSRPFPNDYFQDHELRIEELEDRYLVKLENEGQIFTAGHFLPQQLNTLFGPGPTPSSPLSAEDVLNLGLAYSPTGVTNQLKLAPARDESLAVKYLIQLLGSDFADKPALQKKAVRLLTQRKLMQQLTQEQYPILINALESSKIRKAPYNAYELAQVYHSRAFQNWNRENRAADLEQYRTYLTEYIEFYDSNEWIRNATEHPTEAVWYEQAQREVQ